MNYTCGQSTAEAQLGRSAAAHRRSGGRWKPPAVSALGRTQVGTDAASSGPTDKCCDFLVLCKPKSPTCVIEQL